MSICLSQTFELNQTNPSSDFAIIFNHDQNKIDMMMKIDQVQQEFCVLNLVI